MLITLLQIVQLLLTVFTFVIVAQAILSWLIVFNVINTYNEFVRSMWNGLKMVTEPVYRPIRRILPDFGALDISPLIVLLVLYILNNIVIANAIRSLAIASY
ncbi:YggT family protein [Sphingosinithalassobacter portus]|uniref:YggT family protein n=1 Tax=Stakelama portus TaxID=2676234 RepID=UPI000C649FA4|nr:YggT family protein [Sphingosinithalassobacter portus]MBA17156.1 osmotic-shock protein [Sphingomonas sp.]